MQDGFTAVLLFCCFFQLLYSQEPSTACRFRMRDSKNSCPLYLPYKQAKEQLSLLFYLTITFYILS